MFKSKRLFLVVLVCFSMSLFACAKDDSHWGQTLDPNKKWWKIEGQSWDRDSNIFMTIGYSNPDWKDDVDLRKSADLDARSQVAAFMQSLVKNYMEEVRSRNFSMSESYVKATADETLLGSVIVARRLDKKKGKRMCQSLIKVDLGYFFANVYKKYTEDIKARAAAENKRVKTDELDKLIQEKVTTALDDLKKAEAPAVEKSMATTSTTGE